MVLVKHGDGVASSHSGVFMWYICLRRRHGVQYVNDAWSIL
jgi:hypothetical protein